MIFPAVPGLRFLVDYGTNSVTLDAAMVPVPPALSLFAPALATFGLIGVRRRSG